MRMPRILSSRRGEWFALPVLLLACSWSHAREKAAVVIAGDDAPAIMLRENADKPWRFAKNNEVLESGTQVIGGLGATIDSADGAVRARFMGNISGLSPFPILETSIILKEAKDADLAFEMGLRPGRFDQSKESRSSENQRDRARQNGGDYVSGTRQPAGHRDVQSLA